MKQIILTKGKVAIVDDEDFERLNAFKWFYLNSGYAGRGVYSAGGKRTVILMHRAVFNLEKRQRNSIGELIHIDHINHNTVDNRKENIRICTYSGNMSNKTAGKESTSNYLGVSWYKQSGKWVAHIRKHGHGKNLGYYTDERAAAKAYNEAAIKIHGKFANLNILD